MMPCMTRWLKKLHTYAGLLNLSILVVFGIAGLTATFDSPEETPPASVTQAYDFRAPENASDYDAALAAFQFLKPALAEPPGRPAVHRDAANNVALTSIP
jgi:hypothetical protein